MCGDIEGGQCIDRSCCPLEDFEKSSGTRNLCEEFGESTVCCRSPPSCNWRTGLGELYPQHGKRLLLKLCLPIKYMACMAFGALQNQFVDLQSKLKVEELSQD